MRPEKRVSVAAVGNDGLVFGRWRKRRAERRQHDPRGGPATVAEEYVAADPRDVVPTDGTAMAGPGGAPQESTTPDERRDRQRD
jgi:hypothetical protein